MECQQCHQRPATLHLTKIINGEKMEMHLCEQCAKEKGDFLPGSNSFSIHHLLSGLLNFEQTITGGNNSFSPLKEIHCEKCGITYQQFAKIGRFGCAHCYNVFNHKLDPVLRRVHSGNTIHSGKIPQRGGMDIQTKRQLQQLKENLQAHIANEEFEKAAEVRDQIRSLNHKIRGNGEV